MGSGTVLVVLGVVVLAAGAWWLLSNPAVQGGIHMVTDPRFTRLMSDLKAGKISQQEAEKRAESLGTQMAREMRSANYVRRRRYF